MSQAWSRVWKRDDEIQNLPHFQFIWCGCWWMHRWTMAVLPHMCIGFPTLLMEQTIVTSYNDVTRISQSIEGNIKGECNQARGLWLLLSLSSGSFDTSVKLYTRPQTLYLSCLSAPWVGRISWMYSVVCFSHKHGWPRSLVSHSPVMSLTSKGPSWGCPSSELQFANKSTGGEVLEVSNLKGSWAGRFIQGRPGPLAFTLLSDMAQVMALWPSCNVMWSMVR